jgi:glucose/arabinose dehydrogenase
MTDLTKFPAAIPALWSSGCPTIAPSGATFLNGPQWSGWSDGLAVAVLKGQRLQVIHFFGAGDAERLEWTDITDRGRLRVAVQGPDGNLYLATDANPGAILRVVPTPAD